MVQLGCLGVLERKTSAQHRVQYHTAAPYINHDRLVSVFALYHFRSSIAWGPAGSFESFIFTVGVGKSEINNPDGFVVVNQEILRFKIAMDDVQLMNVLNTADDLLEDFAGFGLRNSVNEL